MNLEEMLRREARTSTPNPLQGRVGEIVAGVRRRRRARAAGASVASVATVATIGVIVWQVTAQDIQPPAEPADPSITPAPTEVCSLGIDELLPDTSALLATSGIRPGETAGTAIVTTELQNPDDGDAETPARGASTYAVDPGTGRILGYWADDTETETITVSAGNAAQVVDEVTFTACSGDELADGDYDLYVRDQLSGGTEGVQWFSGPTPFTVTGGVVGTDEPTDEPTEEPAANQPAPEFEPVCATAWAPPEMNTGLSATTDLQPGAYTGEEILEGILTATNESNQPVSVSTYTWVVLVRDGQVVSPNLLGSDDVLTIDLAPGESADRGVGHMLADFCAPGWTPSMPTVDLAPGTYQAYPMLMDTDQYAQNGTRNVLAIADPVRIEITG